MLVQCFEASGIELLNAVRDYEESMAEVQMKNNAYWTKVQFKCQNQ